MAYKDLRERMRSELDKMMTAGADAEAKSYSVRLLEDDAERAALFKELANVKLGHLQANSDEEIARSRADVAAMRSRLVEVAAKLTGAFAAPRWDPSARQSAAALPSSTSER